MNTTCSRCKKPNERSFSFLSGSRARSLNTPTQSRDKGAPSGGSFFAQLFFCPRAVTCQNTSHLCSRLCSHFGEAVVELVCAITSCLKPHKEAKRTNVGRHAVNYGPAGRENTPHVDWKNGGFQLDCRFILTWHAAGRVGGCDDWRKEEKENERSERLETSDVEMWGVV